VGLKISCILLAYNQEDYLDLALSSIESQTRAVNELIITDDASTDSSKAIIKHFIARSQIECIRFIDSPINYGINETLNNALSFITGDIVFLQAGDDISDPGRVQFIEETMTRDPQVNFLLTSYRIINNLGEVIACKKRHGYLNDLKLLIKRGAALPTLGMAFRVGLIKHIVPLDNKINNEDDYICFAGMLFSGGIFIYDFCSYSYRIHVSSISGWSTLEQNETILYNKWKEQQTNRRLNWIGWIHLLKNASETQYASEIVMLEKRIQLNEDLENLLIWDVLRKLKIIFSQFSIMNTRDWLYLIFGFRSLKIIRLLKAVLQTMNLPSHLS